MPAQQMADKQAFKQIAGPSTELEGAHSPSRLTPDDQVNVKTMYTVRDDD